MKKLVVLLALMIGLSAAAAHAKGITIRAPGVAVARIVVKDSTGRVVQQVVGGRVVSAVILDTVPNGPYPSNAGIRTKTTMMQLQVYNSAFGGTQVATGTVSNAAGQIYIIFNGTTWTISQNP